MKQGDRKCSVLSIKIPAAIPQATEYIYPDLQQMKDKKASDKLTAHFGNDPAHARLRQLTPVILDTQEAEIRRIMIQSQPGQIVLEKTLHKKELLEWLKA
jgi:hypothetical protein